MKGIIRSFPVALRSIFTDPVNFLLAIIPTLIALTLYFTIIVLTYRNSDRLVSMFRGYIYSIEQEALIAKVLTAILIIFIFFLMSWTFVIIVGLVAAPFNSLLSSRIENKLANKMILEESKGLVLGEVKVTMMQTFKNELKKLIFVLLVGGFAVLLNFFPIFYPVGIFLFAILLAVQFVDYSWSRYDLPFGECLKDVFKNIVPYSFGGGIFLLLIAIPVVNAFVPAFATSYFTVLWLYRHKKIEL